VAVPGAGSYARAIADFRRLLARDKPPTPARNPYTAAARAYLSPHEIPTSLKVAAGLKLVRNNSARAQAHVAQPPAAPSPGLLAAALFPPLAYPNQPPALRRRGGR